MNIVTKLLSYQNQVKILHWQTTSYAEHKTLDGLYGDLSGHIDEFVEIFMGKYGRVLAQNTFNLILENYKNKLENSSIKNELEKWKQIRQSCKQFTDKHKFSPKYVSDSIIHKHYSTIMNIMNSN